MNIVVMAVIVMPLYISKVSAQPSPTVTKNSNISRVKQQPAFIVKTIKLPSTADTFSEVSVNPNTNLIYVLTTKSITVIDGRTNQIKGEIPLPYGFEGLAINPNTNQIYTSNPFTNKTTVVDGKTNVAVKDIKITSGYPTKVAVNPNTNMVYVVSEHSSINVIDGKTNTVIKNIPIGQGGAIRMAVDPRSNTLYVIGGRLFGPQALIIIDGKTSRVIGNITIPVQGLTGVEDVAVNPNTNMIYLPSESTITVIDGKTHLAKTITHHFASPSDYHPGFFWNVAVNPNTNMIYTSNPFANTTTVIDGRTNLEVKTIPVGFEPFPLAVNAKTNAVYVLNTRDNTMSIITQVKR
jgi:YVTN family beta-propeller protein